MHLTDLPSIGDTNEAELLVGGWSWRRSRFEAFKFFRDSRGDYRDFASREAHALGEFACMLTRQDDIAAGADFDPQFVIGHWVVASVVSINTYLVEIWQYFI